MKNIYRIAKLELSTMFYSPIAWLLLIIFIVQNGITFMGILDYIQSSQQYGNRSYGITSTLFTTNRGLYPSVLSKLYLYIPLLTMGLISRETSSGSIKLLLSSPVKTHEIVFGKYLAMMAYGALMAIILLAFVITGGLSVENFDWKYALSGWIGIYLLICAYAAIGLFMSSLTTYQVVAAISTLAVLALLNYIGEVGQRIGFIRDITYFLSIAGRVETMVMGLLVTKDVLYFLIVIMLFIGFTILKLRAGKVAESGAMKFGRYVGLTVLLLMVGYIGSLPKLTGYKDMTARKINTLTQVSQDILRKIDQPVKLTTYVNLLDWNFDKGSPEKRNIDANRFAMFRRFLPSLQMDYEYYYDQRIPQYDPEFRPDHPDTLLQKAKVKAKAIRYDFDMFKSPAEMRKEIDLRPEGNRLVRRFEMGQRTAILRNFMYMPQDPTEREISASIKSMLVKPPKVGFITGHNERSVTGIREFDYTTLMADQLNAYSLVNQGFESVPVALDRENIATDIDIVVLADPKLTLTPTEIAKLEAFINKGGNLLIATEPGRQAVLEPILAPLGVSIQAGMLVQDSKEHGPNIVITPFSEKVAALGSSFSDFSLYGVTMEMPGVAALAYKDSGQFHITPILNADPANTWKRSNALHPDSITVSFIAAEGDQRANFPMALALTRKLGEREQRIMVLGDADCLTNDKTFQQSMTGANYYPATNIFRWLSNDEFPIKIKIPPLIDKNVTLKTDTVNALRYSYIGIVPFLVFAFGGLVLFRRSRS